jgi:uncharacterized membrane protein YgcG
LGQCIRRALFYDSAQLTARSSQSREVLALYLTLRVGACLAADPAPLLCRLSEGLVKYILINPLNHGSACRLTGVGSRPGVWVLTRQTVATLREEDLLRLGVRSEHARLMLLHLPYILCAAETAVHAAESDAAPSAAQTVAAGGRDGAAGRQFSTLGGGGSSSDGGGDGGGGGGGGGGRSGEASPAMPAGPTPSWE